MELPTEYRNGEPLPHAIDDIINDLGGGPELLIRAQSTHPVWGVTRIFHLYYIRLIAQDVSRIRTLMKDCDKSAQVHWTGSKKGGLVKADFDMFDFRLSFQNLSKLQAKIMGIVAENATVYTVKQYYAATQYSKAKYGHGQFAPSRDDPFFA